VYFAAPGEHFLPPLADRQITVCRKRSVLHEFFQLPPGDLRRGSIQGPEGELEGGECELIGMFSNLWRGSIQGPEGELEGGECE
jgi:hypothetical protein